MRILVVDDDEAIRVALRRCLSLAGHEAVQCADGTEALSSLMSAPVDAAILDWNLPDISGVEICRRLRAGGDNTPVLMLTARSEVGDRVEGLDAGADDFLAKPFEVEELLARLRALLRRSAAAGTTPQADDHSVAPPLTVGDLVLDRSTWSARRGERAITLTRTEFSLLEVMMQRAGQVVERPTIMREVWEYDFGGSNANLDVYVSYLRRKLEADGEPRMLHTVRGVGFTLRAAD